MSDHHQPPSDAVVPPPVRRPSRKGHRRTRRKALFAVLAAVIVLGGFGGAAALGIDRIYDRLTEGTADFDGPPVGEEVVQITAGSSIRAIGRTLAEAGVVRTEGAFVAAARGDSGAATLSPGFYRMQRNMPAELALDRMLDPDSRILARIVIPEGSTVAETVAELSSESGVPAAKFTKALDKPKDIGLPEWAKGSAEGFLFPATYNVEPNATAQSILTQMTDRFAQAVEDTHLLVRSEQLGFTPYEVLTVASLIEAEVKRGADRPKAARVIYNRLERGMKLQLDSTVHYAVGSTDDTVTTTDAERATDSKYNTYKYPGLPPGPICSPGQAAIEAALAPAPGQWLFFVTVNPDTGETKFAVTAAEHAENVAEFRAWARQNADR